MTTGVAHRDRWCRCRACIRVLPRRPYRHELARLRELCWRAGVDLPGNLERFNRTQVQYAIRRLIPLAEGRSADA